MERFFLITLFLLSYSTCTILLIMDGAVVEHDYKWIFSAIGITMATLLGYLVPLSYLLRDYFLDGTDIEQSFAKLWNPVGPLMGIGVAFALNDRKGDAVGPYLYWILLTAVFCIFFAIVLFRPVGTDFGLFYTFCTMFVNFSMKQYHNNSRETYWAVGICVALVLLRALLEFFAVCARKKATQAAAASTAVDAAIAVAAASTVAYAAYAAIPAAAPSTAPAATASTAPAAAIAAATASTAADAAIPAAAASTAPAAAIPAAAASTAPAAAIPVAAIPAAAIPAAADATVASAVTSHEA